MLKQTSKEIKYNFFFIRYILILYVCEVAGALKSEVSTKGYHTHQKQCYIYTIAKLDHEDRPPDDGFVVVRINTITKLGNIYNNTVEGFGVVRINTIAKTSVYQ